MIIDRSFTTIAVGAATEELEEKAISHQGV
jgi:hypothetical protein